MSEDRRHCLNCAAELTGAFCHECGQRSSARRLDLKEVIHDAASHFLNLDSNVPLPPEELPVDPK